MSKTLKDAPRKTQPPVEVIEENDIADVLQTIIKSIKDLSQKVEQNRKEIHALKGQREGASHVGGYVTMNAPIPEIKKGPVSVKDIMMRSKGRFPDDD